MNIDPGFRGEIADYYARYRRGYPAAVADAIAAAFDLCPADVVLDLGCGTGQLSVPLAARAGRVIGMDPEPDMLAQARKNQIKNILWVRGTDRDVAPQGLTAQASSQPSPAGPTPSGPTPSAPRSMGSGSAGLASSGWGSVGSGSAGLDSSGSGSAGGCWGALRTGCSGSGSSGPHLSGPDFPELDFSELDSSELDFSELDLSGLAAMTVAVAIHWMDRDALFRAVRPMLRPGGGIAVVTNGTPLWLQDADWSRAARALLEELTGHEVTAACQTDQAGRRLTTEALESAGYRTDETTIGYDAPLTADQLAGGLFSAMSADELPPPERRPEFVARLAAYEPMVEHVNVTLQFGWPR